MNESNNESKQRVKRTMVIALAQSLLTKIISVFVKSLENKLIEVNQENVIVAFIVSSTTNNTKLMEDENYE